MVSIEILLQLAGLACVGLVIVNFVAPKRLGYASSLENAELLIRQIFYVHCGYIVLIIAALGVLCLASPILLLEPGMGQVLSGFFAFFWGSRVVVQLVYYDKAYRARERGWDIFFLLLFASLAVVFGLAAWS